MISILRKRFLPALLAIMVLATMTACGSKGEEANSPVTTGQSGTAAEEGSTGQKIDIWGKYSPEIEISSVKNISSDVAAMKIPEGQTWDKNPWSDMYLKDFGIKYKVLWAVPDSQYEQKLGVAIASNQLPDITAVDAVQLKKIIDSGMATDMTKAYQDYISPAAREFIEGDGGMALKQCTFDGKLMALPLSTGNTDHPALLYIRKDWLDKVGLQPPKTVEDLLKISEAFTKQDPDKNGKADTYGLGLSKELYNSGNYELTGLLASFGAYKEWIRDSSGKLVYGSIQPQTKTALEALAQMYKNGEIDQEFGVKDSGKVNESVVSGKIGMFYGAQWTPFSPIPDAKKNDPKADWRAYPIPSVDGSAAKVPVGLSASTFYVINKNCKNPEAAVKMLNAYVKYDPFWAPDYDPIYHHGSRDPQNPKQPMPGVSNPGYKYAAILAFSPTQNIDIYTDHMTLLETNGDQSKTKMSQESVTRKEEVQADVLRMKLERKLGYIPYPESKERFDYVKPDGTTENRPVFKDTDYAGYLWSSATFGPWAVINNYIKQNLLYQPEYFGSPTETMTSKGPTLDKMRVEVFTKIIMGAGNTDEFEKYINNWKKLGGDRMTEEVNEWDKNK